jgi:hypothetical protein
MPSDAQLNLPGYLSFEEFSKPSQAKWFKNAKGNMAGASMTNSPAMLYEQWLKMLRQRQAGAAQPPPAGGGGGSRATGGGLTAGAAGPGAGAGKPPGGTRGGSANVGGAPPGQPGWGKGGRSAPGGPTIASQNRPGMSPMTGGGLQAPPQGGAAPDPMAINSRLLQQYQGGAGRSMMGGKG